MALGWDERCLDMALGGPVKRKTASVLVRGEE